MHILKKPNLYIHTFGRVAQHEMDVEWQLAVEDLKEIENALAVEISGLHYDEKHTEINFSFSDHIVQ